VETAWAGNILGRCLGLRPGESVLVLTDEPLGYAREALCATAAALGAGRVASQTLAAPAGPLAVVPGRLLEQVREADVIVTLLSELDLARENSVLRAARAAFRGAARGRWAAGAQIDADVLEHELAADFFEVERVARRLAAGLSGADLVRVTAEGGTDLTLCLGERPLQVETGMLTEPGSYTNLPAGEVFTAPLEESAEGRLVVDGALGDLPLDVPVAFTFLQGRVVSAEGGAALAELRRRLGADPWAWTVGELGVGANPFARVPGRGRGLVAVAEKALGTVHIALGGNLAFGGKNPAETHYDCVVRGARLEVAGGVLALR
jgi:leucyl aminopeptidase (aminopeptidase T)